MVETALGEGRVVYGVTTGFGQLSSVRIDAADAAALQVNLLRSHAVGSGEPLDAEIVRGMVLLLASSLRRGHSGVRPEVVELLLALLGHDVVPVIPEPRLGRVVGRSGPARPPRAGADRGGRGHGRRRAAAGRRGARPGGAGTGLARGQGGPRADQRHPPDGGGRRARDPRRATGARRGGRRRGALARGVQGLDGAVRRAAARAARAAGAGTGGRAAALAAGRLAGGRLARRLRAGAGSLHAALRAAGARRGRRRARVRARRRWSASSAR